MLLPDPEPRERHYKIVSVDDHLCEPPDLFEGRLPAALQDRAPRVIELDNGDEVWTYEGKVFPNIAVNAVVGLSQDQWGYEPVRFDGIRKGSWDIDARIIDMDLAGIEASLCFPSQVAGFAGVVFAQSQDPELGLACARAWNDWHHEVWAGRYPGRMIPLQVPWLVDPKIAAQEVYRNAERGFRAVTFPESPSNVGFPSVHDRSWDPFWRACEETQTVLAVHVGSGRFNMKMSPDAPRQVNVTLFPFYSAAFAADFLWSQIPLRFPNLKVALAEGGIGWVPAMLDRLQYAETRAASFQNDWSGDVSPSEAFQRAFYLCMLADKSTLALRDLIGIDHIMLEVDYPHADSTWPDSQAVALDVLEGLPQADIDKICFQNASDLFRFPLRSTSA